MLEFCTLGTGGTLPLADRALSSLYVRVNGRSMLIDCGEGTQDQGAGQQKGQEPCNDFSHDTTAPLITTLITRSSVGPRRYAA